MSQPENVANTYFDGRLNVTERELLSYAILNAPIKPKTVLQVGTWLRGRSTIHILRALDRNNTGHLGESKQTSLLTTG
jgi:hypothetical protein